MIQSLNTIFEPNTHDIIPGIYETKHDIHLYFSHTLVTEVFENKLNYQKIFKNYCLGSIDLQNRVVTYPPFECSRIKEIFEQLFTKAPKNSFVQWHAFGNQIFFTYKDLKGNVSTVQNEEELNSKLNKNPVSFKITRNLREEFVLLSSHYSDVEGFNEFIRGDDKIFEPQKFMEESNLEY